MEKGRGSILDVGIACLENFEHLGQKEWYVWQGGRR